MMASTTPAVVVGLGKTGLACARYLAARGEPFLVADTRPNPPGLARLREEMPSIPVRLGSFDATLFSRAPRLILSPGISLREPAVARARAAGVSLVGDIELFVGEVRAPVVAVTGSNGKSTVTTMVGAMAARAGRRVRVGGNIGTPALELLAGEGVELYVLELSSFQLETTHSLQAAAAAVLNVSPDHMDRYRDLGEYAAAKARIFMGQGKMVLNRDDPRVLAMASPGRRTVRFGLGPAQAGDFGLLGEGGERWLALGDEPLMPARALKLRGEHNLSNALAALALGHAVGLEMPAMLAALREFEGLPHRCQWVAEREGVTWLNDSKGTNVGATVAAIEGLGGSEPLLLIAGGDGKGADFSALRTAAAAGVKAAILLGRDAHRIRAALADAVPVVMAASMDDAVRRAAELAEAGDSVLFSPACASFDMYSDFEERGEAFVAAVRREFGP